MISESDIRSAAGRREELKGLREELASLSSIEDIKATLDRLIRLLLAAEAENIPD